MKKITNITKSQAQERHITYDERLWEVGADVETQRVAREILAAWEVFADPLWDRWADRWLLGQDRSALSARLAAEHAENLAGLAYRVWANAARKADVPYGVYLAYLDTAYAAHNAAADAAALDLARIGDRPE